MTEPRFGLAVAFSTRKLREKKAPACFTASVPPCERARCALARRAARETLAQTHSLRCPPPDAYMGPALAAGARKSAAMLAPAEW